MSTITVSAGWARESRPSTRAAQSRPTSSEPARPADSAPTRLTRRARLLITGVTLVVAVALAVLATGGGLATAGTARGSGSATTVERVTVRPGETLWEIARREAPGVDPRETIATMIDLNALDSAAVAAGRVLLLPPR